MPWLRSLQQAASGNISVSGYKRIDFAYQKTPNGSGDLQREEALKLQVTGQMSGTTINADIQQTSSGGKADNKSQIDVLHERFRVKVGDFRATFASHELMRYEETLEGAEAQVNLDGHYLGLLLSMPKGVLKKELIQGTDSQGPFVLSFRPVVPGSEYVNLGGQIQIKGRDYTIDYETGEIRFLTRFIRAEEQLEIRYETENTLYQDQLWGLKYDYVHPNAVMGVTYLDKKETQSIGFAWMRQGITHYTWHYGTWGGQHEWSWSQRDSQGGVSNYGWAVFNKGIYQTPTTSVVVDALTASETFMPVSVTSIGSGDYRYGIDTKHRDAHGSYQFFAKDQRQSYGDRRQVSTALQMSTSQEWPPFLWQTGVRHEVVSEVAVSGNTLQAYQRQVGDVSLKWPLFGMSFSEQIQVERKVVSVGSATGFRALQSQSRVGVVEDESWQHVGEATLRWQQNVSTRSVEEQVLRWTSAYTNSPQNYVQSVVERRYQTEVFPKTLGIVSAAYSPFPAWQQQLKFSLESLKEAYNQVQSDAAKWDLAYDTTWRPVSGYETRYAYKTQFKDIDRKGVYPYANQEFSWENRWALWGAQWSVQRRERIQSREDMSQYPIVSPESHGVTKTTIARFQNRPLPKLSWQIQTESEDSEQALDTGQTVLRVQRLKTELGWQIDRHTAGLTGDVENKEVLVGTETPMYQGRYGVYVQYTFLPSTVRGEVLFTHYRDTHAYESYTPSVLYTFRPSVLFDLSVKYSFERVFGKTGLSDNHSWELGVKSEVGNLIVAANAMQVQKVGVDDRFEAALRMTYVFR